jgi:hypothetical protein
MRSYATYYNEARTHLSVNKDAPSPRTVHAVGRILPKPFLGGLHPSVRASLISDRHNKVAMAVFFFLASVLPNNRAKALLAYRLKTGHRSALGFAKEIIGSRVLLRNRAP